MKIGYEKILDSDTFGEIKFVAENAGDGHTLGFISDLLECKMLSDDRIEYWLSTSDLILILMGVMEERNK